VSLHPVQIIVRTAQEGKELIKYLAAKITVSQLLLYKQDQVLNH
jgi:hypothetical protein